MSQTKNPLEWGASAVGQAASYVADVGETMASAPEEEARQAAKIQKITKADLDDALKKGWEDFKSCRTDIIFHCLLYTFVGLFLAGASFGYQLLPLLFPAMAGFALLGPLAAVGLYEMSRRREADGETGWNDAFKVLQSPSFGVIFILGLAMIAIFALWIFMAQLIYNNTLGPEQPASILAFATDVFTTPDGWAMIAIGMAVGFIFALVVLVMSTVSFPLLLDKKVGLPAAVAASITAFRTNPSMMARWGLMIAGALVLGMIPLFLGLVVVLPLFGHATWHLYRKLMPASA